MLQPTEALEAHPIEELELHLLVREPVEALQYHDAHHRLDRIGRPSAFGLILRGKNLLDFRRQRRKVDHRVHLLQGIAQAIELGAMFFCGKEVRLDRGAARHGSGSSRLRTEEFYQRPGVEGFFEVPHDLVPFRTDKRFHHSSTAVQCFP